MDDIRLVEASDEYLVLETATGERYRLLLDDQLRAATKRTLATKSVSDTMSPREIQEQIRAGASVAHLASITGLASELIEKFAAPVLDEIAFVVASAQSIRLSIAGSRPNTTEHVEFGEVIAARLRASGASENQWQAIKLEGSAWRVSVNFNLGTESHLAAWLFEPKKLTLAPENDMAIRLSTEEILATLPPASLRVLSTEEPVAEVPVAEIVAQIDHQSLESELDHQLEVETSATTDLLEAMRRKRENRKVEPEQPQSNNEVESATPLVAAVSEEIANAETEIIDPETVDRLPAKPAQSEPKKQRASMPSWDQIVFGAKADD